MYVRSNTPKYVCEACRNKIPIVDLEGIFHEQLRHIYLSPEEVATYVAQADEGLKQKEEVLQSLTSGRQRLTVAMDRVFNLLTDGQISGESFDSVPPIVEGSGGPELASAYAATPA